MHNLNYSSYYNPILHMLYPKSYFQSDYINRKLQNSLFYNTLSPLSHKFLYESHYISSPRSIFVYSSATIIGFILLLSICIFIKQSISVCHTYCCITNISNNDENETSDEDSENYEPPKISEINDNSVIPIIINKKDDDNDDDLPTYGEIYNNHI